MARGGLCGGRVDGMVLLAHRAHEARFGGQAEQVGVVLVTAQRGADLRVKQVDAILAPEVGYDEAEALADVADGDVGVSAVSGKGRSGSSAVPSCCSWNAFSVSQS